MKIFNNNYDRDHRLAKAVMAAIELGLTCLVMFCLIEQSFTVLVIGLLLKEAGYFYGVNTVAYIIETIKKHPHRHNIV
jgi:1,4-dihydroxy-2-naphthoate octaprenyltransferase